MDTDVRSEAAKILEEAYERFLFDAYRLLEDDGLGDLNNPVIEKEFGRVDKCFKELILLVDEAGPVAWYSASLPSTTNKPQ